MDIFSYLENKKGISFNEQQRNAVVTKNQAALILAVPGSGKTTVLVSRIAHLILNENISPSEILTVTFGRESAADMRKRFIYLFDELISDIPKFSTIHSFCFSVLRLYSEKLNRKIPTNIESSGTKPNKGFLLRRIYSTVNNGEFIEDEGLEALSTEISFVKNMMMENSEIEKFSSRNRNFSEIYTAYEKTKKDHFLMDFDDMLLYCHAIFKKLPDILKYWQNRYRIINVDEAQDTSKAQHSIIRMLKGENAKIFMVGDEDQSIYAFRGAYPEGILKFKNDYPNGTVYKMEQNFRSNREIVSKANQFIKNNSNRYDKNMFCKNDVDNCLRIKNLNDFSVQYADVLSEIENTPENFSIAVIFRNNESALPFVDFFEMSKISYKIREHNPYFFKSPVVRDIKSFMNLSYNSTDAEAFGRIYYKLFISKAQYEYSVKNTEQGGCFFKTLYNSKLYDSHLSYLLLKYIDVFPKLKNMKPFDALMAIENDIGYKDNLVGRLKSGYSLESAIQKLNILKTIASTHSENESFWNRLEFIEKIISGSITRSDEEERDTSRNITLTTAHSCKGLEFDKVFIIDLIDGQFPGQAAIESKFSKRPLLWEEENRLFYVAFTRAKKEIILYTANKLNGLPIKPSRYIKMCTMPPEIRTSHPCVKRINSEYSRKNKNFKSEEHIGRTVAHAYFGEGFILEGNGESAIVKFKLHGEKHISLEYCLTNNIIRFIN